MTPTPRRHVGIEEALFIHGVLLRRHGGGDGLRDPGALESALLRPQMGYYGDIVEEAAALLESLAVNHPFVDPNKRVAFGVVDVFLRINGHRIESTADEVHDVMITLFEENRFRYEHLEPWLRGIIGPRR
ncbi:MAG: type II toxin-antitoxin system death-on-curing family toxin [Actinomycetota bacterium]